MSIKIKHFVGTEGEELFIFYRLRPANCYDELNWVGEFTLEKDQVLSLAEQIKEFNLK